MSVIDPARLEAAYQAALAALLAGRAPEGYWVGELSSSALSTATAVSALALVQRAREPKGPHDALIARALAWLAEHQNRDGGWGDTDQSVSNISTTILCCSAFHIALAADRYGDHLQKAGRHLEERYGATAAAQALAVRARYGKDRTFAVPILMTGALAGLVAWEEVPALPFELACLPQQWFRFLRLPVVSYALPALIAVGQAIHHHRPPRNPLVRLIRRLARAKSLAVLAAIQPASGGFLEATPLTSFVVMSLASIGQERHAVARHGVQFLLDSARPDGSWPIDTNLSTWVTTLAINALHAAGELPGLERKSGVRCWLIRQQYTSRHPYTGADPGGWAWTPLPGGVPDADDTAGALLALARLTDTIPDLAPEPSPRALARANLGDARADVASLPRLPDLAWEARPPIVNGFCWLFRLQNADGGWPTFCRGWGTLPFDRSGTDLTAHVLRACAAWQEQINADRRYSCALTDAGQANKFTGFPLPASDDELQKGLEYLEKHQRSDGSWVPLWFGNQAVPNDENPTYGTARVLAAYRDLGMMGAKPAQSAVDWLVKAQNADGGWGGGLGSPSSIEETALALDALLALFLGPDPAGATSGTRTPAAATALQAAAVNRGLAWLVEQVEAGRLKQPSPIGFYFAKLWYYERLYPVIFSVAALGRARPLLGRAAR